MQSLKTCGFFTIRIAGFIIKHLNYLISINENQEIGKYKIEYEISRNL